MSNFKQTWSTLLLIAASLLGAAIAALDYITPSTGIDHSYGVLLVLVSSLAMTFGCVVILSVRSRLIVNIFTIAVLLDIIGSGFAAYMLESNFLMAVMMIAAAGWLFRMAGAKGQS
jgi:hypothetical protein